MKLILPVFLLLCVCCGCSPRMTNDTPPASMPGPPRPDRLTAVPDVAVTTAVGHLPRLPRYVPGVYRGGRQGPPVRVIWPAPADNRRVAAAGTVTVTGRVPGTPFRPRAVVTVTADAAPAAAPRRRLEPFPLSAVVLNPDTRGRATPFIKNREKFLRVLADTDPDRFLFAFRDAFGRPQPAGVRPLGVWDSRECRLRGHATGHYLSALAQVYAGAAHDTKRRETFGKKMAYMIDTLAALSRLSGRPAETGGPCTADPAAVPTGPGKERYDSDLGDGMRHDCRHWGEGFISAYPPDQFIMLERGAAYGDGNDEVWAPYYTLHKILAGLLDCREAGAGEKALAVAEGMATWVYRRLKAVPPAARRAMWDTYIAGEYGGMNEVMARLHTITGAEKYRACAQLFDNTAVFFGNAERAHGLAKNVDTIRGRHANQHIPQMIGALATYAATGDGRYYRVAENFWDIVTRSYRYAIGGVAGSVKNPECFTPRPDTLFADGFNEKGQNETCATYNLLKLSRQLCLLDPDARYMDYYEQGLYNHILASVAKDNPGNTYHVPLNPGARKTFTNPRMNGFTCCNGTALESNTKFQDSIYFRGRDNATLYVNLYIPSTVTWEQRDVVVTQQTCFPYDDGTTLTLAGGGDFTVMVRVPRWATRGFSVAINGADRRVDARPGTYLPLARIWRDGDTIAIRMPFGFYLRPVMDEPRIAAIFYGPVLLAAAESGELPAWRPVTLDAGDIGRSITGDPAALRFETNGIALKPFFETYTRHSVYFDVTLE